MTLFSSSGLKSVFFCSVARMYFICPTIQFIVLEKETKKSKTVQRALIPCFPGIQIHTDLSIPVSSFTSICSITSFFLCRHSANFGDELERKVLAALEENILNFIRLRFNPGPTLLEALAGRETVCQTSGRLSLPAEPHPGSTDWRSWRLMRESLQIKEREKTSRQ